jgi:hypothetical protein
MDFADKNEAVAAGIVTFATIGGLGALALGIGIWPLIIGALCLSPLLAAFNDGLRRNPHNHGGGGYQGHRGARR